MIDPQDQLFIRLSVNYFVNPKVIELSPLAQLADIKAMCFLMRAGIEDGTITPTMWTLMNGDDDSLIDELVTSGRWVVDVPNGWKVRGWENWKALDAKKKPERKATSKQIALGSVEDMTPSKKKWTTADAEGVFECWVESLPPGATRKFTKQRKAKVEARLNEGYTVAELCKAVKGWVNDPWPDRVQHNDIVQLLRDGGTVERFVGMFDHPPKSGASGASFDAIDEVFN